jgi:membrane protein insertase Oxa1/YidC/SpoIIIJ
MPLITIWIGRSFPAALPLYWIISSVISIIQQSYILKQTDKITVKQADEITLSDEPEAVLEADIKMNEQKTTKKGVTVTVRKKSK